MFKINLFTLFVLILFSIKTFALESTDKMNTQIMRMYAKNVLVLNRGIEDGVDKTDHIKITSPDGFIARGICLKSSMLSSHWKIYRVVRPELVSKDVEYKMVSINQSEIPKDIANLNKVDFSSYFNSKPMNEKKEIELQQKRIAKYDLPQSLDAIPRTNSKFDKFVSKQIAKADAPKYANKTHINFFASPISWQSRLNQKESQFGAEIFNSNASILYDFLYQKKEINFVDPVTQIGYKSESNLITFDLEYYNINDHLKIVGNVSSFNQKIGETNYPIDYLQFAPIGLKYYFYNATSEEASISYLPSIDQISYTSPISDGVDTRSGFRHKMNISLKSNFGERVKNHFQLEYAPFIDSKTSTTDYADTNTHISNQIAYKLSDNFYTDYIFDYQSDKLRSTLYNVSNDNTIQTIRFRYEFKI